jgi:hypothetical protein
MFQVMPFDEKGFSEQMSADATLFDHFIHGLSGDAGSIGKLYDSDTFICIDHEAS